MNEEMEKIVQEAVVEIADSLLTIGRALQAIAAVAQHTITDDNDFEPGD